MKPEPARDLHGRVVANLDALQAHQVRRRARNSRLAAVIAAVVGAAALFLGWRAIADWRGTSGTEVFAISGDSAIERRGTERAFPSSSRIDLDPSDELRTGPASLARASLPSGANVEIGPSSRLRFEHGWSHGSVRDRIELMAGRIDVQVPKLPDGSEVRVHTREATVVVHGTKFSVERTEADETRVAVTEGKVVVYTDEGERMLLAGANWVVSSAPAPAESATAAAPRP